MNNYTMSDEELLIHKIINDTRAKYNQLEIDEVVHEIAKLNYVRQALEISGVEFSVAVCSYRDRLLKHIEEL